MKKRSIGVSVTILLMTSLCFAETMKGQKDLSLNLGILTLTSNAVNWQRGPVIRYWKAVVTKPVANMYSRPSAEADLVSQAIYATNVELLEMKDGWLKVRTPDDYRGWMQATSLRRMDHFYAATGRIARVEALFADLYREPDLIKHKPVLTIPFESRLEVISEPDQDERRWIEIRLPDDRTAWIHRVDVIFDGKQMSIKETIAWSKRFLGLPYLWGGTSTFGYDCSGFTHMLLRRRGVSVPHDAGPQADWKGFVPVKLRELRPGDLLFFSTRTDRKINHTGMYMGNREFINATTYKRPLVQISRLDDPYWSRIFVGARRLKDSIFLFHY